MSDISANIGSHIRDLDRTISKHEISTLVQPSTGNARLKRYQLNLESRTRIRASQVFMSGVISLFGVDERKIFIKPGSHPFFDPEENHWFLAQNHIPIFKGIVLLYSLWYIDDLILFKGLPSPNAPLDDKLNPLAFLYSTEEEAISVAQEAVNLLNWSVVWLAEAIAQNTTASTGYLRVDHAGPLINKLFINPGLQTELGVVSVSQHVGETLYLFNTNN
jgi:hypothetical protein